MPEPKKLKEIVIVIDDADTGRAHVEVVDDSDPGQKPTANPPVELPGK